MDRRLQNLLTLLIVEKNLEGFLLSKFDLKIVKEDIGPKGPDGKALNTACLSYANGKFCIVFHEDFYNKLGEGLDEKEAAKVRMAILRHEAAHFINRHLHRKGTRDALLFNIAGDMSINQFISNLPSNCVLPPKDWPEKETAETYYELLEKNATKATVGKCKCGKGKGKCDKCIPVFDHMEPCKSDLENGEADAQAKQMIKDTVEERLKAGEDKEKMRGLYGGALESIIKELTNESITNWRQVLSRFAANFTMFDSVRTLKKPDRRNLSPWGHKKERKPKMIVAIDTSGSVSDAMLIAFFSQVRILGMRLEEIRVIGCDADVTLDIIYRRGLEKKFKATGRGGTSFTPVVALINKEYTDYDGLVYLTDGYCPLPDIKCKIPVLWVVDGAKDFPGKPAVFVESGK